MFHFLFSPQKRSRDNQVSSRWGTTLENCETRVLLTPHVAALVGPASAGEKLLENRVHPSILPETFTGSWTLGGATSLRMTQTGTKVTGGFYTTGVLGTELKLKGDVNIDNLVATAKGRFNDSGLGTGKAKFIFNLNLVTSDSFTGTVQLVFKGVTSSLQPVNGSKFIP